MSADYFRYAVESARDSDTRNKILPMAEDNYLKARKFYDKLHNQHPKKLGFIVNFSVYQYEVLNERIRA